MPMSPTGKTFHPLQIVVRFVRAVSFQVPRLAALKTLSSIHSLLKLTKLLLKRQLKSAKRVILPLLSNLHFFRENGLKTTTSYNRSEE